MKKYLKQLKSNKKGFTLIEMIVVIAIIGVLAAILVPSMAGYLESAKGARKEANAKTVYTAAQVAVTSLETTGKVENTTHSIPASDKISELHTKIQSLIGKTNYDKFDQIDVTVADGAVIKVVVREKGADEADTTEYPKSNIVKENINK